MHTYKKQLPGFAAFTREVDCYRRLAFSNHVPNLISKDVKNWTIDIEYAGLSVQQLQWDNKNIIIPNMHDQLNQIAQDLHRSGVMHLDANVGNLLVRDDGHLFLIDFEKACIDGVADNHKLHKRLRKLRLKGGLTALIVNWETMLLTVRA